LIDLGEKDNMSMLHVGELSIPDFNQDFDLFMSEEKLFSTHPGLLVAGQFETLPEKEEGNE
jgi:hypothetical protein